MYYNNLLYIFAIISSILLGCAVVNSTNPINVEIDDGVLTGNAFDTHFSFLGIPFTQPPVGNLRFTSPIQNTPWKPNTWNATFGRPGCPQLCNLPAGVCPYGTSEDCLYLNVYTPVIDIENPEPLPVMVFIPGGRFEMGAANTPLYDGAVFCNRSNVILVTINYRLGVLGFLATEQLAGNYGFEDQLMALQWVQDNIKAFGGDPSQVTVFGESAGGTSAALHLISPKSNGLFGKIIIESNPWALPIKTAAQLTQLADKFAKDLGCDVNDVACMMNETVENILMAQNTSENYFNLLHPLLTFLPWTPVIDGALIPDEPLTLLANGQFNKVPVIAGTNHDEALIFVASISEHISGLEFRAGLVDIYGLINEFKITSTYSSYINSSTDYMLLLSRIGTDYIFVCPNRNAVRSIAKAGLPVYQYQFQHVSSFNVYGNQFPQCADAVCHGLELPYVFDTVSADHYVFTPSEQELSYQVMDFWTSFAKSGVPSSNVQGTPDWTEYQTSSDNTLIFQTPSYMTTGLRQTYCDFWDTLGYQNGW